MAAAPLETLEGVVERIIFSSEADAWSVIRLRIAGQSKPVTSVGNLLGVQPGENLRLSGRWGDDPKYGRQFRASSYVTVAPSTLTGLEKYLGSGMIQGIGPVIARRLVAHFGLDALEIIDDHPERLAEVKGIGQARIEKIRAAWIEQREIKNVLVFLQSHGISATFAARIYKRYGNRALGIVRNDPYRLARDIQGIGFLTADALAGRLGIGKDSPRRATAGVSHVLGLGVSEGHVFIPRDRLVRDAGAVLDMSRTRVEDAVDQLIQSGEFVAEPRPGDMPAIYRASMHAAETNLAARLLALSTTPARPLAIRGERAVAWFEKCEGLTLAPRQREAILKGLHEKVLILTGGPGTGKTTLVNAWIRILGAKGVRIRLCAPTGRAARRLADSTGWEATTVHRLLEYNPRKGIFERHAGRPLQTDLVIVDEASMLDLPLSDHLISALPSPCRLFLVGDVDQLPSVGPGNILGDMIHSRVVAVLRLEEIFRQAKHSQIVANAHRVNHGKLPRTATPDQDSDFFFIEKQEPEQVLEAIERLVARRIPARFHLDAINDIQVLTPMYRGLLGTHNLNARLQALLNPEGRTLVRGGRLLRVGDKVMQVHNDYQREVFNGDVGRVVDIDSEAREVGVRFDGRRVLYGAPDLDELTLAYACSVHKAQGSEYPCVVMVVHSQHHVMLQRNLLYTGITRGRQLVILVGSRRALSVAVRNNRVTSRLTRLAWRLRGGKNSSPGQDARSTFSGLS
ncbi:MAG: ATP-dependent RecD-like DNA helicase [Acidobacteriota bacterium]